MSKKCTHCRQLLKTGGAWLVRCKAAMNNKLIFCEFSRNKPICHTCSGLPDPPADRHGDRDLWARLTNPPRNLTNLAQHRVNGVPGHCTFEITPYIVHREFIVSFGTESGKTYAIPENHINSDGTPDIKKVWTLLKGRTFASAWKAHTVGSTDQHPDTPTDSHVFLLPAAARGNKLYGGFKHFHVGPANFSGKGTLDRVWYNLTGNTIKFSNILDD
jgi:hypothetical protein